MAIEIRELIIKVQIEEGKRKQAQPDLQEMKRMILRECRREIRQQLKKQKDK